MWIAIDAVELFLSSQMFHPANLGVVVRAAAMWDR
jgi:hypothetical protein